MPAAGPLRERVAFDARVEVDDGTGNTRGDWTPQCEVAARIRRLRGGEEVIGQRLQGVQPVVIIVRASAATRRIQTDWRARDTRAGTVFAVRAVTPDEKRQIIDLLCESGVAP